MVRDGRGQERRDQSCEIVDAFLRQRDPRLRLRVGRSALHVARSLQL